MIKVKGEKPKLITSFTYTQSFDWYSYTLHTQHFPPPSPSPKTNRQTKKKNNKFSL